MPNHYAGAMEDDLHALGEALVSTAARIIRWAPTSDSDLSLSAARILARLQDTGGSRISDLAIAEKSSQPTITNHIKRLEAAGFVRRTADPSDARAWTITTTEQGRERLAHIRAAMGTNVEPYLAQLDEVERAALGRGIEVMQHLMTLEVPAASQP